MDGKFVFSHSNCTLFSQIGMNSALNRAIEHGLLRGFKRRGCACNGVIDGLLNLFFAHVRSPEYIEHRGDVHADITLEFNNLFDADFNIPIDIILEGARIGHDDSRIVEKFVDTICECLILQSFMLPNDV